MKGSAWAWCAALILLCGALVYFNRPDSPGVSGFAPTAAPTGTTADAADPTPADVPTGAPQDTPAPISTDAPDAVGNDVPSGHEEGQRLEDFSITCLDGSEFALSGQRGRVVVINLWATWCTPCVNELPHFDRLQTEYGDGAVRVLAIHSDLITDSPEAYLAGYDYAIPFAVDETGEVIRLLGGSTMLPQTIVVDGEGVVSYNRVGSLTYEALEQLIRRAGAEGP